MFNITIITLQRPEPKGQKGIFLAAEVAKFWYTHKAFVRIALLVSFFLCSFKIKDRLGALNDQT